MSETALPPRPAASLLSDQGFGGLKAYIIEHTGLAYYRDKDGDLSDRVSRRLSALRVADCASYLAFIKREGAGEVEMDALIAELTIGETYFFRHAEQWDALKAAALPDILERNARTRRLRVWSAGCSSGEEPYTLSILLKSQLARELAGWDVSILATDINRDVLARAREGTYGDWAFRTNPDEFRREHFNRSGKGWSIDPKYKQGVTFQYHNLVKHPFPSLVQNISSFDLIVCRNAMIYFSPETCAKVVAQFQESLVEDGWFMAGHAELMPELPRPFQVHQGAGATLDKNAPGGARGTVSLGPPVPTPVGELRTPSDPFSFPWIPPALPEVDAAPAPRPVPAKGPAAPAGVAAVRFLADQGKWEEAAAQCRALMEEEKLNPVAHFYNALILEQVGTLPAAEESLRRAIYLDRRYVLAHYHLGLFLQKRGDLPGAGKSFKNVLALLDGKAPGEPIPDADGATAADFAELTGMHMEVIKGL